MRPRVIDNDTDEITVSIRPRKSFSRKFRAAFFNKHGGKCSLCNGRIDGIREAWEIEHTNPLGLTGSNGDDNLTLVHAKCHKAKTSGDVSAISKAKRRQARHVGAKAAPVRKLQSQGFVKVEKERKINKSELPPLPRKTLFEETNR